MQSLSIPPEYDHPTRISENGTAPFIISCIESTEYWSGGGSNGQRGSATSYRKPPVAGSPVAANLPGTRGGRSTCSLTRGLNPMEVPGDCEEDDLPLASRGSVKFWYDLHRDQAPHGSTCGADWEPSTSFSQNLTTRKTVM